jgi:Helicase associated domain
MLDRLKRFADVEGHTHVPNKCAEDSFRLGPWVATQRTRYKAGKLSVDRVKMLDSLPAWRWSIASDHWLEMFQALQRFSDRVGHSRVPSGVEETRALRSWVVDQRRAYENHRLPDGRIADLESLPGWAWNAAGDRWNLMFESLERYVDREGHARVPPDHVEDSQALGPWCQRQRVSRRRGTLSKDHIALFETVPGWTWNSRYFANSSSVKDVEAG